MPGSRRRGAGTHTKYRKLRLKWRYGWRKIIPGVGEVSEILSFFRADIVPELKGLRAAHLLYVEPQLRSGLFDYQFPQLYSLLIVCSV